jgi:NAD(P)-dependent dehydrogenase (short-subunit alcohol dehydrogenase family)
MLEKGSVVAALSSESVGEARAGLGAYSASKAALEQSMRSWRGEHPWIRFSTVVVGATFPTEFGTDFDGDLLGEVAREWSRVGQFPTDLMPTAGVVDALVGVLGTALAVPSVGFEHLVLRSPSPPSPPF